MRPDDLNLLSRLRDLAAEKCKRVLAYLRYKKGVGEAALSVERACGLSQHPDEPDAVGR
jgi:hypothetical protein